MKPLIVGFLAIVLTASATAQNLNHIWSTAFGDGTGEDDYAYAITTNQKGEVYVAGTFEGFIDFDPDTSQYLMNAIYGEDGYVAKYDTNGQFIWAIQIETRSSARINAIALDRSGNVLVSGYYTNRIDFDPTADSSYAYSGTFNNANGFVAKYSPKGTLLWGLNIGGNSVDNVLTLSTDHDNNVIIGGGFSDTVDFDPGTGTNQLIAPSFQDAFVAKYDSTGQHLWAFSIGASTSDYTQQVAIDDSSNIIVSGTFSNQADFDPSSNTVNLSPNGRNDAFLAKYTSQGQYVWAKTLGGIGNEYVYGMQLSPTGFIYLAGTFERTADFDPSSSTANLTSSGRDDLFFAKYNRDGSYVWAKGLGTSSDEDLNALALDGDANLYITGYFVNQLDFDPSSSTNSLTASGGDIYVSKYDSSGNHEWAFQIGDQNFETGYAITTDNAGHVWTAGYFVDQVDFDPGTGTANLNSPDNRNPNGFIARYRQNNGQYNNAWTLQNRLGEDDEIMDVAHDSKGNVYALGYFNGSIDVDPSANGAELTSNGGDDVFLVKYDSLGRYKWAISLGSASGDMAHSVACDAKDQVYISGTFIDSIDLDPSANSHYVVSNGSSDIFLAKYSDNGQFLWGYGFGGRSLETAFGLSTDASLNVWVTGYFRASVDFDPGSGTTSFTARNRDCFVSKFSRGGQFQFASFIGGNSNNYGYALVNGSDNCLYLTGEFRNTCDFDPSSSTANLSTSGTSDPFIAKYDSSGAYQWAIGLNGGGSDRSLAIDIDARENIYITGAFQSSNDFDPSTSTQSLTSGGGEDIFVASYDSSGNYRWAHGFGSNSSRFDRGNALDAHNGVVYITGYFSDTVDFNPSTTADSTLIATNPDNPFVLKLDTLGQFVDAAHLVVWRGYGNGISVFENKAYVGGSFMVEGDFDPDPLAVATLTAKGEDDVFIARYGYSKPCKPTSSSMSASVCGPYRSPANKLYQFSGTYRDTVQNAEGCDSIITINLTIRNSFDTIQVSRCSNYTVPSNTATYTSSGTYFDTLQNAQNCDSIITIHLQILQNADTISVSACDSFVVPSGKRTLRQSGVYIDSLQNQNQCDSLLTIQLTVLQSTDTSYAVTACDSFRSPGGRLLTSSGTYFDTLTNQVGCDSLVEIALTINRSTISQISRTACDSFQAPSRKTWWTASGTYLDTVPNSAGCDSVITCQLTILPSKDTVFAVASCVSYILPSGSDTVHQSGNYQDTLYAQNACDSVLNIQVEILQPTTSVEQVQACDSLQSPSGNWYFASGTYLDTIANVAGCDSIITLNVLINQSADTLLNISACDSVQIAANRWANTSGTYFDTLKTVNGCDSLVEMEVSILQPTTSRILINNCGPITAPWGETYSQSGTWVDTIPNVAGCDSIITLELTIYLEPEVSISPVVCDAYVLPSGNDTLRISGNYWDTLQTTANGCDSILRISLTVETPFSVSFGYDTTRSQLYATASADSFQWYICDASDNRQAIAGANDSVLTLVSSGTYAVEAWREACDASSVCEEIIRLYLPNQQEVEWDIYPNPAHDKVMVHWAEDAGIQQLVLRNSQGQLVERYSPLPNQHQKQLSLAGLAKGVYYLELSHAQGTAVKMLVKSEM